jgi:PDZ domain-containing protein
MRFSPLPLLAKTILSLFLIGAVLMPLPYVVLIPGNAVNIFDSTIKITGHKIFQPSARLDLLSILVSNPDSKVFGPEVLYTWIKGDRVVYPRSAIFRKNTTAKAEEIASKKDMKVSQNASVLAAIDYLNANKLRNNEIPIRAEDIAFDVRKTGGPSGGFVFTLGIVELLTEENILGNDHIAGTGTISPTGSIGPIGGIAEKIIAAHRAGATIFMSPISNCKELSRIPKGMRVIAVTNLGEAIDQLRLIEGASENEKSQMKESNGCANVGA